MYVRCEKVDDDWTLDVLHLVLELLRALDLVDVVGL